MRHLIVTLLLSSFLTALSMGENWPHWRGPQGNGVSPEERLPLSWSSSENIAFKAPLRGSGVSSPIVWGEAVFVSSQLGRGTVRPGDHPTLSRGEEEMEQGLGAGSQPSQEVTFLVQAFDRSEGSLLWEFALPAKGAFPEVHNKNNMATPSCVSDGQAVFCWFGTGQLIALSTGGQKLWERSLAEDYGPFEIGWGHASSPTLHDGTLYLLCDHGDSPYLLALDAKTGREEWKKDRSSARGAYSTPMVVRRSQGDELIVNASDGIDAYDPSDGDLLWYFKEDNRFPVPSPSFGDGIIFTSRGYRSGPYMAIQPGGRGDISESHVKWRVATGAPYVSSVVYYQGIVFFANDSGVVTAADGATGESLWKARVGGVFSASPVAGDGKVYLTNEGGETIVMRAARQPEILSRNPLRERTLASPAISNGRIYIRTDQHLFAVESP